MPPSSSEIEVDVDGFPVGVQVHGDGRGAGTPLVLLHAFSITSQTWDRVAGELGADRTVVAFDRLGFGRSGVPPRRKWGPRPNPFSAESTLRTVLAVLPDERPVLMGSSAGGTIALLAALAEPQRFAGLVLVDAPAKQGPPPLVGPAFSLGPVRAAAPAVLRAAARFGPPRLRRAWAQPGWAEAMVELTLATVTVDLTDRLPEIELPTLVVVGAKDRIVPVDAARAMAAAIPDAELAVIEGAGHLPHESAPAPFLAAVRPFLQRVDAAR